MQIQPQSLQGGKAFAVNITAGRIGRAVGSVATDGEDSRAGYAGDALAGGQGKFLVPATFSVPGQANNSFPSGDISKRLPAICMAAKNRSQETARFPCLTGEHIGQENRLIAQTSCGRGSGGAQFPHGAVYMRFNIGKDFRRFLLQKRERFRTQLQAILFHYGKRFRACAAVGVGGSACNAVKRIAQNIAEDDTEDFGRGACQGETPALDGGKPFPDAVYLHNIRTAGEQLSGDILQLLFGDQWKLKQSTAAAGQKKDNRVLLR